MRPIVGVMPLWDEEKNSIWMLPGYLEGIEKSGGIPMIFPMTQELEEVEGLCDLCQGFLLTGGQDVKPSYYGEKSLPGLVSCQVRDRMERMVLKHALKKDKPVLGICRGIQLMNVYLGGSLYQDLPKQRPSDLEHRQKPPYDEPIHAVKVVEDTPLSDCLKEEKIEVNSYHHQAIKDLSPELTAMAYAEDQLVEAVYREESSFFWGIQWHPEYSFETDKNSRKIFQGFVDAMLL